LNSSSNNTNQKIKGVIGGDYMDADL